MTLATKIVIRGLGWVVLLLAVSGAPAAQAPTVPFSGGDEYILGPEDQIKLWALGMEEISDKPLQINPGGYLDLPVLGRIKAAGLTVDQLRSELLERLSVEVREPSVSIDILEFGSQPVSIMGAVTQPGVHQLRGRRTLAEVLSLAGGLRADAGPRIKISRRMEWGKIPLPTATADAKSEFSVAEINLKDFLAVRNPAENILIRPHDVITVPSAEMIYVIGAVAKPGGFALNEHDSISALQALSLAGGLGGTHAAGHSTILRLSPNSGEREEIKVDLKRVLAGKARDVALQPNDILFVPDSASKRVTSRVLEATVQTLSGLIIWSGF
jgi:polysaccharide export outer membrane protein